MHVYDGDPRMLVEVTFRGQPGQVMLDGLGRLDRRLQQRLTRSVAGVAAEYGGAVESISHTVPKVDSEPTDIEYGASFAFGNNEFRGYAADGIDGFIAVVRGGFPDAMVVSSKRVVMSHGTLDLPIAPDSFEKVSVLVTAIPRPGVENDNGDPEGFATYSEATIVAERAYGAAMILSAAKNAWWHINKTMTPEVVELRASAIDDIKPEDYPDADIDDLGEYRIGDGPVKADPAQAAIPGVARVVDADEPDLMFDAEAWFEQANWRDVVKIFEADGLPGPSHEVDSIFGWLAAYGHYDLNELADSHAVVDITIDRQAALTWLREFRPEWTFEPAVSPEPPPAPMP